MSGWRSTVRFGKAWDMRHNLRSRASVASGSPGATLVAAPADVSFFLENNAVNRVLMFAIGLGLAASPLVAQKKKIAVMDFDFSQVRSSVSDIFGSDVDVGKAIADLVYAALQKNGSYDLAPRQPTPACNRQGAGTAEATAHRTA